MAASVRYYPLVGLLDGSDCASSYTASHLILPSNTSVVLAIAIGLFLTGAFHEDGLADTFDGIGGGLTRETSLQIMKDSRLGTYGTLALVVMLALKAGSLMGLSQEFVIAAVAGRPSRLSSVFVIATSFYVRDHGTGKPVAGGLSAGSLAFVGSQYDPSGVCFSPFITCIRSLWSGSWPYSHAPLLRKKTEARPGTHSATSKRAWILYGADRMG